MNDFVSWCRHLLVSFLFYAVTSLHPLHFIEMIFPLVPHIFHFGFWGKAPTKMRCSCSAHTFTHAHAHADNAPSLAAPALYTCVVHVHVNGVAQCLPVEEPHDLP